jgi:hypothetical protein
MIRTRKPRSCSTSPGTSPKGPVSTSSLWSTEPSSARRVARLRESPGSRSSSSARAWASLARSGRFPAPRLKARSRFSYRRPRAESCLSAASGRVFWATIGPAQLLRRFARLSGTGDAKAGMRRQSPICDLRRENSRAKTIRCADRGSAGTIADRRNEDSAPPLRRLTRWRAAVRPECGE